MYRNWRSHSAVNVPVIGSGGVGTVDHAIEAINNSGADAIAMADILHYGRSTIGEVRDACRSLGFQVRSYA